MSTENQSPVTPAAPRGAVVTRGFLLGFALITSLFFLWAVANNFNDVLIRQFQKALDLDRAQAGLIQFVFYAGYFIMALPAGLIMKRFGYKAGILLGLALYAAGALIFIPAADVRIYGLFLGALFIIACGAAFLETAANPYIVAFGDPSRAAQRLNLAQSFNGLGGAIAPLLGGLFILSGVEYSSAEIAALSPADLEAWRIQEAATVKLPYLGLAMAAGLLAILIAVTRLPPIDAEESTEHPGQDAVSDGRNRLATAVVAQFFYVGAQVGVWSYFIDFTKDVVPEVPERQAAFLLSLSLFLFMAGRFIGTALMNRISPRAMLSVYALIAAGLCGVAIVAPGWAAVGALGLTSFFMSIMFPTIFALGVLGLGPRAKLGSSLIVMAIIGGALAPLAMGYLSVLTGDLRASIGIPLVCFVIVAACARRLGSPDAAR